jgi:Rhs element Vgr protein
MNDSFRSTVTSLFSLQINGSQHSVLSLTGSESLFLACRFEIVLLVDVTQWSTSWLLKTAQLFLSERTVTGVITEESAQIFDANGLWQLRVTLEPRLALLRHQTQAQIFLNKSVPDILRHSLQALGYTSSQLHIVLQNDYPLQSYIFQPPLETDLAFLQRIAAKVGIFFWSESDDHREYVCITDNNQCFKKHNPAIVSYTPPSNLPSLCTSQGFYFLTFSATDNTDHFIISDYNEQTPDDIILREFGNLSSVYSQQIFGMGCAENNQAAQLGKNCFQSQQCQHEILICHSALSTLSPAKIFSLDASLWNGSSQLNQEYYVIEITHEAKQPAERHGFGAAMIYQNQVKCVSAARPFCWPPHPAPALPNLLTAHIESDSQYSQLDDEARYTTRMRLDQSAQPYTQAMPPLRRLSQYGSRPSDMGASGVHFPLRDQAEVLISHLYGDPDRTVIIGCLYNAEQCSPVTTDNYQQHILQTAAGNLLLMDDSSTTPKVHLENPQAINVMQLNATPATNLLLFDSQGQINCQANNNITYTIGNNCTENIAEDYVQTVGQNYSSCTQQQDLNYQIIQNQQFSAEGNIFFSAQQNINFSSANQIIINAQQMLNVSANGKAIQLSANENLAIQSAQDLHIIGGGQGCIIISCCGASIEITNDGTVNLTGQQIVVTGQPIFSVLPS